MKKEDLISIINQLPLEAFDYIPGQLDNYEDEIHTQKLHRILYSPFFWMEQNDGILKSGMYHINYFVQVDNHYEANIIDLKSSKWEELVLPLKDLPIDILYNCLCFIRDTTNFLKKK